MNPVIPGGGTPSPGPAKPSSGVLESDTVAQPAGAEATEIGPGSPSALPTGSRPATTDEGRLLENAPASEHHEPEMAAFLSHLAADETNSRIRTGVVEPAARAPEPVLSPGADADFAPTTVLPKSGDSGTARSPSAPLAAQSREISTSAAPRRESEARSGQSPSREADVQQRETSNRARVAPETSAVSQKPAKAKSPSSKTGASQRPASARSSSANIPLEPVATTSRRIDRRLIAAGATGAVLLLAIAGYLVYGRGNSGSGAANSKKATARQNGTARKTPSPRAAPLRRELTVGPAGTFRSIAAALADIKQNGNDSRKATQIIKVAAGQTYAERIAIDETFPRGIQIIADAGLPAILAPPGSEPIVVISGGKEQVENFRLEGFHLHAAGKEVAVQLSARAPAARLKRLQISGFKSSGVLFDGTQTFGADNDRIMLEDVTFHEAGPEAVGIRFQKQTDDPMHVRIERCRFLAPLAAGVGLDSGVIDVEILESIFFGTRTGVRLEGAGRTWRDVVLAFNTFYENERALLFTNMPGGASNGFGFYNNLFVGSQSADAHVEKDYNNNAFLSMIRTTPGGASHNWTTRPKPESPHPEQLAFLFENVHGRFGAGDLQFQSVDPANADFLAPAAGSPHQHVGTLLDRRRFGDQIGAVRGK